MNFHTPLMISSICVFCTLSLGVKGEETVQTLDELVKTWTALRQEISAESREWQVQKSRLEMEMTLLQKEFADLAAEEAAFKAFSDSGEQERQALLAQKDALQAKQDALKPLLDRMEEFLVWETAGIPEPIRPELTLKSEARTVDRVQAVATDLIALEKLYGEFHVVREILEDGEGERREMEVLYWGQAIAYAVSTNDDWAGIGQPDRPEWVWEDRPEIAPQVRKLLKIMESEEVADFVDLPIKMKRKAEVLP
ncbi:DUF3450 family protein [Kiritimatiellaeota bacterium B1221]|nr:DUF3450 family protein [Kiritimatiellaeota bacterium B1221]